jgi:hypothetical protein
MSKAETLRKVCNAIRQYKGLHTIETNKSLEKWTMPPKANQEPRLRLLLAKLGLNPDVAMKQINEFETTGDFENWIKGL